MKLQIERQVVTAKSRKLSARWTYIDTEPDPDTINDMRQEVLDVHGDVGVDESEHTTYGVDIEQEIMDALADEIRSEIDFEFFQSIKGLIDPDDIQDMRQNL